MLSSSLSMLFNEISTSFFIDSLMISYRDETGAEGGSGEDSYIQESFTIHLGSQLKQTYNIRLLCCNPIMDFLRFKNERLVRIVKIGSSYINKLRHLFC